MREDSITDRQFAAAVFTAVLSPMLRVLPRIAAVSAGRWAWLTVPAALPLLLVLALLMGSLRRSLAPGEGAAGLFLRAFGPVAGRVLLALYAGWFLFYAGFILRSGAERLTAAAYQHSGPEPFLLATLAAALLAALGTLRGAARTGVVFRAVLLTVLGAALVLSLPNIEAANLRPLGPVPVRSLPDGARSVAAVGGTAALFSFLRGYTAPGGRGAARLLLPPLALFVAVAAALCLVPVGVFGAALTARLSYPFFTMVRDLSVLGVTQRFEAVVIALWVSADFLLCVLLLRCAHEALRVMLRLPAPEGASAPRSLRGGRWLLLPEAAAAGACALALPAAAEDFRLWSEQLVPLLMCLFVYGGFPLLWLVGKLRKKL